MWVVSLICWYDMIIPPKGLSVAAPLTYRSSGPHDGGTGDELGKSDSYQTR